MDCDQRSGLAANNTHDFREAENNRKRDYQSSEWNNSKLIRFTASQNATLAI